MRCEPRRDHAQGPRNLHRVGPCWHSRPTRKPRSQRDQRCRRRDWGAGDFARLTANNPAVNTRHCVLVLQGAAGAQGPAGPACSNDLLASYICPTHFDVANAYWTPHGMRIDSRGLCNFECKPGFHDADNNGSCEQCQPCRVCETAEGQCSTSTDSYCTSTPGCVAACISCESPPGGTDTNAGSTAITCFTATEDASKACAIDDSIAIESAAGSTWATADGHSAGIGCDTPIAGFTEKLDLGFMQIMRCFTASDLDGRVCATPSSIIAQRRPCGRYPGRIRQSYVSLQSPGGHVCVRVRQPSGWYPGARCRKMAPAVPTAADAVLADLCCAFQHGACT